MDRWLACRVFAAALIATGSACTQRPSEPESADGPPAPASYSEAELKELIASFEKADRQSRQEIAERISAMGSAAVPALVAALRDSGDEMKPLGVRVGTIKSLALIGEDAVEPVIALAREAPDMSAPIEALRNIGPPAAKAVPFLMQILSKPEDGRRQVATEALGEIGVASKDVVALLERVAKEEDDDFLKEAAVSALLRIRLTGVKPAAQATPEELRDSFARAAQAGDILALLKLYHPFCHNFFGSEPLSRLVREDTASLADERSQFEIRDFAGPAGDGAFMPAKASKEFCVAPAGEADPARTFPIGLHEGKWYVIRGKAMGDDG